MDTDRDNRDNTPPWRSALLGAALAGCLAVTSTAGWWDQGARRTAAPRPDVETVAVVLPNSAEPTRAAPPVAAGAPAWAPRTVEDSAGDDGYPDPWVVGNEAVRRWLEERGQGAPGPG